MKGLGLLHLPLCVYACIVLTYSESAYAQKQEHVDLTELSLEQLMNVEVTLVSRKEERLFHSAAAIYVITHEEMRRTGFTSIPEALRNVPGMQVARFDANMWAVTSRGFNNLFANKLLVLSDGRSVYTPMFSGVFWESQDVLFEDLDRIEVVRGPGATLWGSNAVNGIINVITKNVKDTQGGLVTLGGGTEERAFGGIRYGGKAGDHLYYRFYTKYFKRDHFVDASNQATPDGWNVLRGGFRMDWDNSGSHSLTLQGDVYDGDVGQRLTLAFPNPPFQRICDTRARVYGGNMLCRWNHNFSPENDVTLQFYFDRAVVDDPILISGFHNTLNIDFQHRFWFGKRNEVVWGFGYRFIHDKLDSTFSMSFDPASDNYHLFSSFIQDDFSIVHDRLRLTLGSKFEHNDYTGLEIQPNVRLLWQPGVRHVTWAAVSRAVRIPSRGECHMSFVGEVFPLNVSEPESPLILIVSRGSPKFDSEDLLSFEFGYRYRPTDNLVLDVATYYNIYKNLRTYEQGPISIQGSFVPLRLVIPLITGNKMYGETYGGELLAGWRVANWWHLRIAYTYLKRELHLDKISDSTGGSAAVEQDPHNQFFIRSSMDLPWKLELDLQMRYVDTLPGLDVGSYVSGDIRLGWNPTNTLKFYLVGQNLLESHHPEYRGDAIPFIASEVERGFYCGLTYQY
jgi:iron complex outermembrane receptor protein